MHAWTPADDELLRDLHERGKSNAQIARVFLGRGVTATRRSVSGRLHRLGLMRVRLGVRPKVKREPRKIAHRELREVRVVPVEPPASGPIGDFPARGCRWIAADPATPGWRCCGAEQLPGSSYCAHHDDRCRNREAQKVAA